MLKEISMKFVKYIPDVLIDGILYVSLEFETAIHLCACGCGEKVVTPIRPGEWTLLVKDDKPTLSPSIGNRFACKSHYFIRDGIVVKA